MTQKELITELTNRYADISFAAGESYYWSPKNRTVHFHRDANGEVNLWTLLHETSHGLLNHKNYSSDFELTKLEVAAWERARALAREFNIVIDDEHIQDCLDSYRDWQYKRSLCPNCDLGGIQTDQHTYRCMFCDKSWSVSPSRFCRPYRRRNK